MEFTLIKLSESWFDTLKLDQLRLETRRIPKYPSWKCAVNNENKYLFTQLISDMYEMRDGFYYYLLAIGNDLILIWPSNEGKIINTGDYSKYSIDFLMSTVNSAYSVLSNSDMPIFSINQLIKRKNIIMVLQ